MPVFVLFVFGAIVLGAGAMLSPAWPTRQPRIGLAAALALALVIGGTVFYASLFGWQILVIDYLMFALLTGIFLGGTLSGAQTRAEARGEELLDADQGWPGPQDLAFLAVVALIFALPVLILPVPLGDDAPVYGLQALATRFGGTFDTLAPYQPDVQYLYSPGFSAFTAYLSQQLNQAMHTVQFSVGAVLGLLNVWLAYDLGAEMRDKRLGRAIALAMLGGLGLFGMLLTGQYPALMGLAFIQAFWIFALRLGREGLWIDALGAGLMLGATLIVHPGSFILLGLGYVPWAATIWLTATPPTRRAWLMLVLAVPGVALLATLPWVVHSWDLLTAGLESPYTRSADNLIVMVSHHGLWLAPLAVFGLWLGWSRRDSLAILSAGWLFLIFDFSTTGGIAAFFPFLTRYLDPYDLAWHGPVLPYALLGGMALLWLWENGLSARLNFQLSYRRTYIVNGLLALLLLGALLFRAPLREAVTALVPLPDAYATRSDVEALDWIHDVAAEDARLLNVPGPAEGDWATVISERPAVYNPLLPYALYAPQTPPTPADLTAFWQDPTDPAHAQLLQEAEIALVILPEAVAHPDDLDDLWRWRRPNAPAGLALALESAPYLTRVYGEAERGAKVYAVSGVPFLPQIDASEGDNENGPAQGD